MKEVVTKLKLTCVSALTRQVLLALDNARLQIEAQTQKFSGTQLPPLREESTAVAERFMHNLNRYFDDLTAHRITEQEIDEYGNLSLVDNDYLEAIIAMEGMVNHAVIAIFNSTSALPRVSKPCFRTVRSMKPTIPSTRNKLAKVSMTLSVRWH